MEILFIILCLIIGYLIYKINKNKRARADLLNEC